jgi:hypothetical protein
MFVLLGLAITTPALAQPQQQQPPAAQANRREKIKQRIRALRAYTLTEQLDLDETTAGKLFPLLAKFDDEFDKLLIARADLQRRLKASGSIKDPKEVDKLVDEAVANQKQLWSTEEQRLAQLRKILTPAQTARILVVLPAMERKIQNQLKRAAKGGPNAKAADDDDEDGADNTVDPFDKRAQRRQQRQQRQQGQNADQQAPCDPFDSKHGCGR